MRFNSILLAVLLGVVGLGFSSGCKSAEDKACAHIAELAEAAGESEDYSDAECREEINEMKEQCSNPGEVLDCFTSKESLEDLRDCRDVCEEAEGE